MSLTEDFSENTDTPLTDRKQVRARAKKSDIALAERRGTLAEMLKVKQCREFFWWLLEQYGPTRSPTVFAHNGLDAHGTMVNIGMSNAGNILLAEITAAAPDKYMLMLAEEQERKELARNGNA